MHVKRSGLILPILGLTAFAAPAAHADVVTLGSDLSASATLEQAHQADTAFWPVSLQGANPAVPEDGQVLSIKVKGIAVQPQGAPKPLSEFHFQTLDAQSDGSYQVYQSSAAFDLPYTGDANQVSSYTPANLCIHKGGVVDFNDEGGWDGTGTGPYNGGVPFRIFGRAAGSSTSWFSKDNGTKNGALLAPATVISGTELLLQYTLATGDDRSYECGGPLRDPNGKVIPRMQVTAGQDAYVSSDGSFTVWGYCGDAYADCSGGTATVTVDGQPLATGSFSTPKQKSISIPMKLATADYARLSSLPGSAWTATLTLTTPGQGTVTGDIKMHATAGGAMHLVKNQKVYVRGNRRLTPAGFCGVSTGCTGSAILSVKGKAIAKANFATKSKGKITINLRLPASIYKQLKRKPVLASLAISGPLGSDTQPVLLRH